MFANEGNKLLSIVSQDSIFGSKHTEKRFVTDVHVHKMDKHGTEFKLLCISEKSLGDKFILKALRFHNITISHYHKIFDRLEININVYMTGQKHTLTYKKFVIEHLNRLNTPLGRSYLTQVGSDVVLAIPWETMFHGDLTDQISGSIKITLIVKLKEEIHDMSAIFRYTIMDINAKQLAEMAKNWSIGVTDVYYFNALTDEHSELSLKLDIDSPLQGLIMKFDDEYEGNLDSMDMYMFGHQYGTASLNDLNIRHLIMDNMMLTHDSNIVDYFFIPLSEIGGCIGCPNMQRIDNFKLNLSFNNYACRTVEVVAIAYNILRINGFRVTTQGNNYIEEINNENDIMVIEI